MANEEVIRQAYDESVQKAAGQAELQRQLGLIIEYWQTCLHTDSST